MAEIRMITTRITFNGAKVRLGPGVGFKKYQMLALGQLALDTVKARVAKAVGSDDAAMKPLKERYAKWKQQIGLDPIRDLHGPGQTTYQARTYTKTPAQHFTGFKAWWNGLGFGGSANARFRQFHANHPVRMYTTRQANIRFRSAGGGAHMLDNFTVRYADELSVRMDISAQWARDRARANEQRAPWFGFSPNDIRAIAGLAQQMFQANVTDLAVQLRAVKGGAVWLNPNGLQDQMLKRFAA